MKTDLRLKNVSKKYGDLEVLRDINLEVEHGEFVVLVGPSGCGKSTLLRMIAGLEGISSGTLEMGGKIMNDVQPKDRDIAMVFQNYALYPHMSVRENMGFSLRLAKVPKEEVDEKVEEAAALLHIDAHLERYPGMLSGGQRQRVAMGRAIVRAPSVFLFDEPLSNLDAKLRVTMRSEIRELQQRLKKTTIYVTHDQAEAMTMADKVVVMNNGVISQVGKPLDIYDAPENVFVGGFLGSPSMNFVDYAVVPLVSDGSVLPSDVMAQIDRQSGSAKSGTVVGFRPESVVIGDGAKNAQVVSKETTGFETHVKFKLNDGKLLEGVFAQRLDVQKGTSVNVKVPGHALHFFDAETGQRTLS